MNKMGPEEDSEQRGNMMGVGCELGRYGTGQGWRRSRNDQGQEGHY